MIEYIHNFFFFYSRAILECWQEIKCIIQYSLECVPSVYEPIFNLYNETPRKIVFFQEEFNRFKFHTIKRFEIYKNYIFGYIFQSKPYLDTIKLKKRKLNCILVK